MAKATSRQRIPPLAMSHGGRKRQYGLAALAVPDAVFPRVASFFALKLLHVRKLLPAHKSARTISALVTAVPSFGQLKIPGSRALAAPASEADL